MHYHLQLKHHKWCCLSHLATLRLVNGVNPREGSLEWVMITSVDEFLRY